MFNPFLGPSLVFQYESSLQKPTAVTFKSMLSRGIVSERVYAAVGSYCNLVQQNRVLEAS